MVKLQHQDDFRSLFLQSQKVTFHHWIALYRSNHLDRARLGIVIAKRVVRSAVKRNLIRRIVRESFRHYQAAIKGFDIVILIRSGNRSLSLLTDSKTVMRNNIDHLWQQLINSSASHLNRH